MSRIALCSLSAPTPCILTLLSRYYLADGVKLYSQETWRMFMGEAGREMVGKYAQDVTDYYCMASDSNNHCVRESACHSIAEMAEKVWCCAVDWRSNGTMFPREVMTAQEFHALLARFSHLYVRAASRHAFCLWFCVNASLFPRVAGVSCVHLDQVAPQYLATHVDRLLKALLVCFFDESWPVRDAACVASGRFAGAYPDECRPSLDKLYERFAWG